MQEFYIKTEKTARIFSLGTITEQTKQIWIVLHGYAYHAKYFLKKFECLQNETTVIFAPEALNRFYKNGLTGNVGANWMTKEDRTNEINDYILYLNNFYKTLIINNLKQNQNIKINILGFSQGGTTMCRWLSKSNYKVDNVIIWASQFPHDFDFENDISIFKKTNNWMVYGNNDEFLKAKHIQNFTELNEKHKLNFQIMAFNGKHEIEKTSLLKIQNNIEENLTL